MPNTLNGASAPAQSPIHPINTAILSRTKFASELLKQIEGRLLFVGSDSTRQDVIRVLVAIEAIEELVQDGASSPLVSTLVAALRLVDNETRPGAMPYSADAYLPEKVRSAVTSALAMADALTVAVELEGGVA